MTWTDAVYACDGKSEHAAKLPKLVSVEDRTLSCEALLTIIYIRMGPIQPSSSLAGGKFGPARVIAKEKATINQGEHWTFVIHQILYVAVSMKVPFLSGW